MRAVLAAALIASAVAGAAPAYAADLGEAPHASAHALYSDPSFGTVRTEQLVILDYEPGVVTRAWWLSPWRQHYYFPATGRKPRVGRDENLAARRPLPKPAQSFYRVWSTSARADDEVVPRPLPRAPAKP